MPGLLLYLTLPIHNLHQFTRVQLAKSHVGMILEFHNNNSAISHTHPVCDPNMIKTQCTIKYIIQYKHMCEICLYC
jgi:hypothetical protein